MRGYSALRLLVLGVFAFAAVGGEEEKVDPTQKTDATASTEESSTKDETPSAEENTFDPSNRDWGTYYDPQNIFCGKYDCYKILGFDYESFGKKIPDTKEITKRYRKLSREWHPDKSKHKDAKNRFVKISRAYEVLTKQDQREEYDFLRYNQEAYFHKYGTSVMYSFAPKTDLAAVVIILLIIGNIFSWYSQKHRWQMVADRLIKAAIEDWSPSQGGTPESKQLREEAQTLLNKRESEQKEESTEPSPSLPAKSPKKLKATQKAVKKTSGKERKKQEQESLLPIIKELVDEMHDFGGGFHKPTWKDLLIVTIFKATYSIPVAILWQMKYWMRRLLKKELNEEERQVLTARAVGPIAWDTASEEEQEEMIKQELWVVENLVDWKEEQEVKNLSAAEQKMYYKLKKKGKLE